MRFSSSRPLEAQRVASLSPREREVLVLLAEGLTVDEIASRLDIASKTASIHVMRTYRKLGVNNAIQALRIAIRCGLVSP